jgi:hypothetical protein
MSNPNDEKHERPEDDDLELAPETVKDLEVIDDNTGEIRGDFSGSGTVSLNVSLNR